MQRCSAVLSLTLVLILCGAGGQDLLREHGGTLILAIPVREGLVLCGDRWITDENGIRVGEETKIRAIGKSAVFVVSGKVGLDLLTTPRTVLFDANQLTEKYFQGVSVETADWQDYRKVLGTAFQHALEQIPFEQWPESKWGDDSFFQVLVFYVDDRRQLQGSYVRLQYLKQQPPQINLPWYKMVREQFTHALPIPIGNQRVYNELKYGHSPAFEDLHRNSVVQRFVKGTVPVDNATSGEAINFARVVIRATSLRAKLLPGPREPVGPDCDCFVLNKQDGLLGPTSR